MSKVIHLNTLKPYLEKLKVNGGMWKIDNNKYAIKQLELINAAIGSQGMCVCACLFLLCL